MPINNTLSVLSNLINAMRLPLTTKDIERELSIHPEHSSLLSISDTLSNFLISHECCKISNEDIDNIDAPFIAHLTINRGQFAVVNKVTDTYVLVNNDFWHNHRLSRADFKQYFSGTILVVNGYNIGDKLTYLKKRIQEKLSELYLPLLLASVVLIFFAINILRLVTLSKVEIDSVAPQLIKSCGLIVSTILLVQSIDANNDFVKKLCGTGERINCSSVLSSSSATLFGIISWSEIGFFYFAGTFLILYISGNGTGTMSILAWLNVLCIPYTFFSVIYQAFVIKQWCTLCLSIQLLLWVEFAYLHHYLGQHFLPLNIQSLLAIFISFLSPITLWTFVKPHILNSQRLISMKSDLMNFKYNTKQFHNLLSEGPNYKLLSADNSIILGDSNAKNIITIVLSPYCPPCSKAYRSLTELLAQNDNIQARIILSTLNKGATSREAVMVKHLISLYLNLNFNKFEEALNNWFAKDTKNYMVWARKYPVTDFVDISNFMLEQVSWCKLVDAETTPTTFINGYKLPYLYDLKEIKYLL